MAIKFYYNKYDHQYKRIDEKTFNKFVLLRKIDFEFELFYVKNKYDLSFTTKQIFLSLHKFDVSRI